MSKNITTKTTISNLTEELKKTFARQTALTALQTKVNALETAGGQPNVLEGIKVNGALLTLANKIADILIAEGATNGTIKVNNVDVAVHGLAALAYKAQVSETELATALKTKINNSATTLATLTGSGDGSIDKMIDDAFNEFATNVTDDGVVNSYKELIDWAATHGSEAATMAANITANKTAIDNLKKFVGELPEGATATTVVGYIAEAISALSIGDYAKTTEVTAAINTALASYYTKTEIDTKLGGYVKDTDISDFTAAEIAAMLAE